ncbi:MAG: PIG-L family deacetylase [Candidatus Omnitrophica bacterium]|nr:PIG-L family deacetylase [Candidatus Omnitrophota bacterium]
MKKMIFLPAWIIFSFFALSRPGFCEEIRPFPGFTAPDRVLILAAHPDDEIIGTGGVIQRALAKGASVKVVCFTNGEHNELSFIVYEKRLTFRKGEFIHMGEIRGKETREAAKSIGVNENNIMFLGYPDYGTQDILFRYWQDKRPFGDLLTRISKVPYADCLSPGAPYTGRSILRDLEKVLTDFKPTKIFVTHPVDTNRDHRALYVFLRFALLDVGKQFANPEVFPYLIHVIGWPKPRGFHEDLPLVPPEKLKYSMISWFTFELSPQEIEAEKKALGFFKSQIEYNPPYLYTFARQNELFGDYPDIKLKKQDNGAGDGTAFNDLEWQYLGGSNLNSKLAYAHKDGFLYVRFDVKRRLGRSFGISLYLLGYNSEKNFADMPKINLTVGFGGLRIKDKKDVVFSKNAKITYNKKGCLVIKVPLALLGEPQYILSYGRANVKNFPLDDTAWRVLALE